MFKTKKQKLFGAFIVIVLLIMGATFYTSGAYQGGRSNVWHISDVDSGITHTTEWIDVSTFDEQDTIFLNIYYKSGSSWADTLRSISIQGRMNSNNTAASNYLIDSVTTLSSTLASPRRIVGATTGTITHFAIPYASLYSHYPNWRLKVTGDANNSILVFGIYATGNDYIPEKINVFNGY